MKFKIKEIKSKSIIGSTKIPVADFVINPYTGCQFGCMYCYASFMSRFVGEKNEDWGKYVYVKTNAVDLMKKEILRLLKKTPQPRIAISSVTDPYQGVEARYRLTRDILQVLVDYNYKGRVGILTKSSLILRDIEILKKISNVEVGITITTTDDNLSRLLEVNTPSSSVRLDTLKKLNEAGIQTHVFVGPLLPHMKNKPEIIDKLFSEIKKAGTHKIKAEFLNLPSNVKHRMKSVIEKESKEIQEIYNDSQTKKYRNELDLLVRKYLDKHDLKLYYDKIIHHISDQKLVE